jgi:hypothetical protein
LLSGDAINGLWEATMVFPQFSESGTWRPTLFRLEDRVHNVRNMTSTSLDAAGFPSKIVVFQPSLTSDGSVSVAGGTIQDETFGSRASLTFPFGAVSIPTSVALDVLQSPLDVPLPTGFSGADSFFVNIELTPMPGFPLAAPGLTLVLPLRVFTAPGTAIYLFRVNPATGNLEPALDAIGTQIVGFANASGLEATFIGISSLSTVVGLRSGPITLSIDIKPDDLSNVVNLRSRGTVPVVIYSTPTLNSTLIDPATLRLAGAAVATNKSGRAQTSEVDFDGDGLLDLIAHFETAQLTLTPSSVEASLRGSTYDFRAILGADAVRVVQ